MKTKTFKAAWMVATAIVIASCSSKSEEKTAAQAEAKPQVKIAQVSSQSVPQTETYTATVESDVKNNIAPNAPLRIERIYVDVGDVVRKGQVVVQLDASNLRQLKLQIDNQKVEFNRTSALYEVGGASKAEYDNVKMQLDVLETQYRQLVQNTQLVAPISGVVTARNYDNGDMYGGQPVLTIEQTNPVKLIVNISETNYSLVHKGMPVDLTLDAYPGEAFTGSVTIVYPTVNATTHTFPVEITINNGAQKVRPGMFARATLNFGDQQHVMVPDAAVVRLQGSGQRDVFVVEDGIAVQKEVSLGRHFDGQYEILSGLEEGEQVVVKGGSALRNGAQVEVIE